MKQADKKEVLRLVKLALSDYDDRDALVELRSIITRQKPDEDGERWRFCLEHGFPVALASVPGSWCAWAYREGFIAYGPTEAVDAARAAMKGTS